MTKRGAKITIADNYISYNPVGCSSKLKQHGYFKSRALVKPGLENREPVGTAKAVVTKTAKACSIKDNSHFLH